VTKRSEQLGAIGTKLLVRLQGPDVHQFIAASFESQLVAADIGPIMDYYVNKADDRSTAELTSELEATQTINQFSHRCTRDRDHENEWNNRIQALGDKQVLEAFTDIISSCIHRKTS
jgi:hypothetical protein